MYEKATVEWEVVSLDLKYYGKRMLNFPKHSSSAFIFLPLNLEAVVLGN